jgi:para-aminobenzoate synthetase / 4-amino-4-deoxychorismate lyase
VFDRDSLDAALTRIAHGTTWVVAEIHYELGYLLEPRSTPVNWSAAGCPLARFWLFKACLPMSGAEAETWLATHRPGLPAGVGGVQPAISQNDYLAAVDRIKQLIFEGDCYQVNLTFPLQFEFFGAPLDLYAQLRARQPVRYGGYVGTATEGIVSLSPELFIERRGNRLLTRPMKGTAPREALPQDLVDSTKDRAENLMIVDLLRNDLGRVAEHGSVRVEKLFAIEEYPTVRQMVSEISAAVPGRSFGDILRALFPCGSITGAPKIRAMQIIGDLETQPRGLYTGTLGWLAPDGDFRLNVAIRTLELQANRRGQMGVGSGIVADSKAASEYQECLLKAAFLTRADAGIQLIETLYRDDGGYPRLAGHLERLRRSAAWFGFVFDETELLAELARAPAPGRWRVRVMLARDGQLTVSSFPLEETLLSARQAVLAGQPIDSGYPLRRHKTTDRAIYDDALKALDGNPALFDVVFLNERGEVAEGARSNVFVERDGVLLTPPVSSGALPGVLRAELLASGQAREAILRSTDLQGGFFLGNALRGLIPVSLAG